MLFIKWIEIDLNTVWVLVLTCEVTVTGLDRLETLVVSVWPGKLVDELDILRARFANGWLVVSFVLFVGCVDDKYALTVTFEDELNDCSELIVFGLLELLTGL